MPDAERVVVSDTGPFITLERLPGGFELLRQLYDRVLLPERVLEELAEGRPSGSAYLEEFGIRDLVQVVAVPSDASGLEALDSGERAALSLALDRDLPLLIEERAGCDLAHKRGMRFSGIAGQVMKARRLGLLSRAEAAEKLRSLYRTGRINQRLLSDLLDSLES